MNKSQEAPLLFQLPRDHAMMSLMKMTSPGDSMTKCRKASSPPTASLLHSLCASNYFFFAALITT